MHSSVSLQRPELSEKACVFASCNLFWLGNETFFKRKNVCVYVCIRELDFLYEDFFKCSKA